MRTYARVLLCLLLAGAALAPLAAEGQAEDDTIEIGISKFVAHPALDAVEQGIMDELAELGYTNISYDLQNANAEASTANQIATKFKADRVDLAVGIATPTSQALVNTLNDIPVVYSAVTDPVEAGLVPSFERGGDNVTGYSDMTPVKEQIAFLDRLVSLEALGHVYSSGEANAVTLANMAREACSELGIQFVESTITNSAEVRQATQSIVNRVDGIYVSTDNTVVSALSALTDVALRSNIPVMSADPSSAEIYGVLAAWGFDYYKHGRATGRLVDRILQGADPESIPTQFMTDADDVTLLINFDVAEQLGITFPEDVRQDADLVVENGEVQEK